MKYVDNYNKANPKKKMSAIGTLIGKYGDDEVARALVRTTQSSKASAEAKEIAKMLQKEQLALWLHNGKTTYDVFKLLKLGEDGFSALGSSKFNVFESYIQLFNTKNSGQETLLTALKAGFKLATVLMLAKSDFASSAKATKVQTALFKDWLARKIDPASVYTQVFKLDENAVLSANYLQTKVVNEYNVVYRDVMRLGLNSVRAGRS